jgi:hypothetical protein
VLAEEENFAGLARINRELVGKVRATDAQRRIVLDLDSVGAAGAPEKIRGRGRTRQFVGFVLRVNPRLRKYYYSQNWGPGLYKSGDQQLWSVRANGA